MKIAPLPNNEQARLATLKNYDILDTEPDEALDTMVQLASYICQTPIAAISLVDENRQWFKAITGLDAKETHRDISFCAHAILQNETMIVPDVLQDDRFFDNPLVTSAPGIRFYAGVPLITIQGQHLGALCVIDSIPRELSSAQLNAINILARNIMSHLDLRHSHKQAREHISSLQIPSPTSMDSASETIENNTNVSVNPAFTVMTGYICNEMVGKNPDLIEALIQISLAEANATTVLSVTDSIDALLGYNVDEFMTGKISLKDCIHSHDQDIADKLFLNEIYPTPGTFNIRLRQANGSIKCVKGLCTKVLETSENKVIIDILLQDAKSLWQHQGDQTMMTNFKAMMDNTDDYIYFKDRNHVFNGASQALVEITECTQHWSEFLGLTDYDVFLEEYADIYYSLEKQVFAGVNVAHDIQETRLQDGSKGWINNRKFPIKNDDGEIVGLFGIARDITQSKLAEQALQVSEESLRESQHIAKLGSYELNIQNGTWQSSDFLDELFGIDETYERSLDGWFALIHPDDHVMVKSHLQNGAFSQHHTFDKEYRIIRHADQAERWVRGLGKPISDSDGNLIKVRGTIQDVTASHQELLIEQRAILSNKLVGIITLRQRKIIWANPAFENMLGYDAGELVGKPTRIFYVSEEEYQSVGAIYANIEIEGIGNTQHKYVCKDGRQIWVDMSAALLHKETGESLWTYIDITARKQAEDDLRIAATAFESQEGIFVTDNKAIILRVNQAFIDITGYTAIEAVGQTPKFLKSDRHNAVFYAEMWECITKHGKWEGEIWNVRKNGEMYPQYLIITAVKDLDGVASNYVATLTDITVRKSAEDEIRSLAFYDPLTGLPNRRLLLDRLNQAFSTSRRNGKDGALLFLDLDHFKTLNDSLGHDVGDLLLKQVAERLTDCVREGDTVARLGGDEYVIILEGLSVHALEAAAQVEIVGEKILSTLNQPYWLNSHLCHSTLSIGVTLFNDQQSSVEELLKQADIAMYQAKTAGRNTLRFFDKKMQDAINNRASLENELRKALDKQQFQLYYQIQVDISGRAMGAEALIRWIHPDRGMVSPFHFIPLAEETGLILPIGQWVLETACAQLKVWQQHPLTRELTLSINVSAKQFRKAQFVDQVQATLEQYAINPMLLKLELTESMLLDNIDDTIATMSALKQLGIRFSLDDFGTGYSSLQYLKRLPLYQLKIDQSFVRDIAVDSSDQAIVRTIIAMAHTLNLNVIAEGVETEEQQGLLLNNGCTHYQGYLFGKPVPIAQFEAFLIGAA